MFFIISGLIVTSGLLREQAAGPDGPGAVPRPPAGAGRRADRAPVRGPARRVASSTPPTRTPSRRRLRTVTNTLTYTNNLLYQTNPLGARETWATSGSCRSRCSGTSWCRCSCSCWPGVDGSSPRSWRPSPWRRWSTGSPRCRTPRGSRSRCSTFARADALLLGVLLAITLPWLRRFGRYAAAIGSLGCVGLLGLLLVEPGGQPVDVSRGLGRGVHADRAGRGGLRDAPRAALVPDPGR